MKLDAGLGTDGNYLKGVGKTARVAENLGFAGLWTSETKHDAFLPLAVAANTTARLQLGTSAAIAFSPSPPPAVAANTTERIELGTSVAIAFSRSPMEAAQTAWDLQGLSEGRFILGLGTPVKAHVERRFSMPFGRPAARLREYVLAVRAIWESFQTEGPLKFEGEFYRHTLMTPFFNPGPISHPGIPVYIAGVNTKLAHLAAGALLRTARRH